MARYTGILVSIKIDDKEYRFDDKPTFKITATFIPLPNAVDLAERHLGIIEAERIVNKGK